jgi:23S rRNA pseudouridine1911/1915/1917 synthase
VVTDSAIELTVTAAEDGERLDRVLSRRDLGFSRAAVQRFIAEGRVEVDGRPAGSASEKARTGAVLVVRPTPAPPTELVAQDIPIEWLYRDEHLAVLMKPAGLVVHPAPGHPDGTLANALRHHLELEGQGDPDRPGIVHRLDRETSGIMVVAKSERAREGLVALFSAHEIKREYVAIALGHVPERFTERTLHGRHPRDRKRFSGEVQRGKPAVTHVQRVELLHGASLVRCRLETGRTHQIRVHLAERGHPVLADALYGRRTRDPLLLRAAQTIGRQALHARLLGFVHPVTGQPLRFEAEPPEDFQAALKVLRQP